MTAIAKKALVAQPHERRVQRFAYLALAGALVLALALVLRSTPGRLVWLDVPTWASLALLALAAVLGILAVVKRKMRFALSASAALVLAVAPAGAMRPGIVGYALGFAFGAAVLAFAELVHMTQRYDIAHKLVEEEGVPEESLDRVTDEAVKTLGVRAGLALAAAFLAALLALGLSSLGPRALREGLETASPLGVGVVGLALAAAAAIVILIRGARLRPRADEESQEAAP